MGTFIFSNQYKFDSKVFKLNFVTPEFPLLSAFQGTVIIVYQSYLGMLN